MEFSIPVTRSRDSWRGRDCGRGEGCFVNVALFMLAHGLKSQPANQELGVVAKASVSRVFCSSS